MHEFVVFIQIKRIIFLAALGFGTWLTQFYKLKPAVIVFFHPMSLNLLRTISNKHKCNLSPPHTTHSHIHAHKQSSPISIVYRIHRVIILTSENNSHVLIVNSCIHVQYSILFVYSTASRIITTKVEEKKYLNKLHTVRTSVRSTLRGLSSCAQIQ